MMRYAEILFHTEQPIVGPVDGSARSGLEGFQVGDYVGNPMYAIVDEHALVGVLLIFLPLLMWGVHRAIRYLAGRNVRVAVAIRDRFAAAPMRLGVASVLTVISAVIHLLLVFTHEPSGYTVAYAAGAVALGWASWRMLTGRRRWPVAILAGSVVAFWFLGAPPDQAGVVTKLIELAALLLLVAPSGAAVRFPRLGPIAAVSLVVMTGIAGWIGAFATAGPDGGHHGGEFPDPGTLVPYIERLEPTTAESEFAARLWRETVAAIEPYRDVAVAEAAGYEVGAVHGTDHHAQNPRLIGDGRILDPAHPEALIYAESAVGPILVGVMFETDGIGDVGPSDGGPIMVWHAHENVCFGLLPPSLAGLEGPYGLCPIGSLNLPVTGEMLHAWTLPGVPVEDRWGHLDEEWLDEYLANVAEIAAVDASS